MSCTLPGNKEPVFLAFFFSFCFNDLLLFFSLKVVPKLKSFHLGAAQGRCLSSLQFSI